MKAQTQNSSSWRRSVTGSLKNLHSTCSSRTLGSTKHWTEILPRNQEKQMGLTRKRPSKGLQSNPGIQLWEGLEPMSSSRLQIHPQVSILFWSSIAWNPGMQLGSLPQRRTLMNLDLRITSRNCPKLSRLSKRESVWMNLDHRTPVGSLTWNMGRDLETKPKLSTLASTRCQISKTRRWIQILNTISTTVW